MGEQSEITENRSEIKMERKEYSLQKSEHIHVAGSLIETYDMEVQCALETRSLDSRPTKEVEKDETEIDLLLPQPKQKKKEDKKEEAPKEVRNLSGEELTTVVKSRNFTDFFSRSSKFL